MKLKILTILTFVCILTLEAGYKDGKELFQLKCSSCHVSFIAPDKIQENFFKKDNKMLKLHAPSVNMLAFAIMDGSKHIGDKQDPEMQQMEIEEYLKEYLEKPNIANSICDPKIVKYYDTMPSMLGQLNSKDYENLAIFFMNYKKMRKQTKPAKQK